MIVVGGFKSGNKIGTFSDTSDASLFKNGKNFAFWFGYYSEEISLDKWTRSHNSVYDSVNGKTRYLYVKRKSNSSLKCSFDGGTTELTYSVATKNVAHDPVSPDQLGFENYAAMRAYNEGMIWVNDENPYSYFRNISCDLDSVYGGTTNWYTMVFAGNLVKTLSECRKRIKSAKCYFNSEEIECSYTESSVSFTIPSLGSSKAKCVIDVALEYYDTHSITLSFNNGGRGTAPSKQTWNDVVVGDYKSFDAGTMSATGYTFTGWSVSPSTAGYVIGNTIYVKDSATATGQWQVNSYPATISKDSHITGFYYRNGTSGSWTGPVTSLSNSFNYGSILQAYGVAAEGYDPVQTSSNPAQITISTSGNTISLTSQIKTYALTLSCDKGFGSFQYKINGATDWSTSTTNPLTVRPQYQSTWYAKVTSRSGYTYSGGEKSGTVRASDASQSFTTTPINYARPLDAQFDGSTESSQGTENVYYTFEVNSYFNDSAHTQSIASITSPTRDGYQFAGYYTGTNGTDTQVIDATGRILPAFCSVAIYDNTTPVYAKWIPISYTVKVENGYSSISYPTYACTFGVHVQVPSMPDITGVGRAHWRFVGWKATSGLNPDYARRHTESHPRDIPIFGPDYFISLGEHESVFLRDMTIINGATVTLTAQWERIKTRVSIDNSAHADDWTLSVGKAYEAETGSWPLNATTEDGVLSFDAYAGNRYSITATYKYTQRTAFTWKVCNIVNGISFARVNSGAANPVFTATQTTAIPDNVAATLSWAVSTYDVTVAVSNPRAPSGVQEPVPTISIADGNRNLRLMANEYVSAAFSQWRFGSSTSPDNPLFAQNLTGATTFTAEYLEKQMRCEIAMDAKSAAAVSGRAPSDWVEVKGSQQTTWSHEYKDIPYGGSVSYRFTKPDDEELSDFEFAGWFREGGTTPVSTSKLYTVTSVIAPMKLYAKLKVTVTLTKAVASGVTANLILNGTTYEATSCSEKFVIGNIANIGVSLGEGAAFSNWYESGDTQYENPLELSMNDSFEVSSTRSVTARILSGDEVYYVAFYQKDMLHGEEEGHQEYDTRLGELAVSGDSVEKITRSEYAEATGTTPEGTGSDFSDGHFYKVTGTQIATVNMTKVTSLAMLRVKRRKLSQTYGQATKIGTALSFKTLVNQNYVYYFEYGYPVPSRVRAELYGCADDREKGMVDVGANALELSGDGIFKEGTFTKDETASVIARSYNGWRFAGWYVRDEVEETLVSESAIHEFNANADSFTFYAKFERESIALYRWEGLSTRKQATWRSKRYVLNKPSNLTSVRVDAESYPIKRIKIESYSSPTSEPREDATVDFASDTTRIADERMRRLPTKRPERYFSVEVSHDAEVDAVFLGTSGGELAV